MVAKAYIILVALTYLGLALWCSVSPTVTSQKVGFQLNGGSGQSEFMTVYGGLEFAITVLLLLTLLRPETVLYGVLISIVVHASLVLFRTISFFSFSDIGSFTYKLAVGEWMILILGIAVYIWHNMSHVSVTE